MRSILSKPFVVLPVLAVLLLVLWAAAYFSPPVFLQMGNYFFGGPSLAEVSGVWTCVPEPTEDCEPIHKSLLAAVAADSDIRNWWPVRLEFIDFSAGI